jgi:hypothetical protein
MIGAKGFEELGMVAAEGTMGVNAEAPEAGTMPEVNAPGEAGGTGSTTEATVGAGSSTAGTGEDSSAMNRVLA